MVTTTEGAPCHPERSEGPLVPCARHVRSFAALRMTVVIGIALLIAQRVTAQQSALERFPNATPRNILFVLVDDHRHDALGFMNHPFLKTPHLDSLARNGAHVKNAFVTTALCSPSRASILTGLYAHQHKVVDNNNPVPPGTVFFPQHLQAAGYQTGFFGKWHMGGGEESDAPQPGFHKWVSFQGQGTYLPSRPGLNVDGKKVPQKGYVTDELTDYALDWLKNRDKNKPFFAYVSHKAVHSEFIPAERHKGKYKDAVFTPPASMADTPANRRGRPMWVQNQRNSWHGVDFPYHSRLDVGEYYKRYCETLLAVDDSVGRLMEWLKSEGLLDSTLIVYMGDNGFLFGEHGLIDKRCAYEESIRVPMLAHCPQLIKPGTVVTKLVANLDVAPTFLDAAGLVPPKGMVGRSILPLLRGEAVADWRDHLLYEYYWERNFPHTPTVHAIRTERHKYVHYHGIWDTDELYDLESDPREQNNLIDREEHQRLANRLKDRMFRTLEETGGMFIPLYPDRGRPQNLRHPGRSKAAEFPPEMMGRDNPPPRR